MCRNCQNPYKYTSVANIPLEHEWQLVSCVALIKLVIKLLQAAKHPQRSFMSLQHMALNQSLEQHSQLVATCCIQFGYHLNHNALICSSTDKIPPLLFCASFMTT